MVELHSHSEDETRTIARRLAALLRPGDVVALDGPLGAGKTCFVRGLAEGLGIDPHEISSPTFVLCHEHETAASSPPESPESPEPTESPEAPEAGRLVLAHLDGYRLAGPDELETIGWDELLTRPDTIIAAEWADRFGTALPTEHIAVRLDHVDERERIITLDAPPPLATRTIDRLRPGPPGSCPICDKTVARDVATYPFCSPRCRLVDLGNWLGERYRIGGD